MGDTFERIIENKELNAIKTKLELVSELAHNIHSDSSVDLQRYIFVVTTDENDSDELGTWEGSIKQMNRLVDKRITSLEAKIDKRMDAIENQAQVSSQRDIAQDKDLKKNVYQLVVSNKSEMNDKMDKILSILNNDKWSPSILTIQWLFIGQVADHEEKFRQNLLLIQEDKSTSEKKIVEWPSEVILTLQNRGYELQLWEEPWNEDTSNHRDRSVWVNCVG